MICKCGCGLETNAKCGFYKGHWNKGRKRPDLLKRNLENNPWRGSSNNKKLWENRRRNGFIVWNKGLDSENDQRIKKYSEKRNENIKIISIKISKTKKEKYKSGELTPYWKGKNRKSDENFIEKMRISTINRIIRQGKNVSYNQKSIPFFESLNKKYNLEGVYGKNEFKCIGYSLDFYSKKYNLVIEWDEEFHYKEDKLNIKDRERQDKITDHLCCKFIRIRESKIDEFNFNTIKDIIDGK
jgi:very-short-patch-repair endonuclease